MKYTFTPANSSTGEDIATLRVEAQTNKGLLVIEDRASEIRADVEGSITLDGKNILDEVLNGKEVEFFPDFGTTGSTSKTALKNFNEGMEKNGEKILFKWAEEFGLQLVGGV